MNIRKKLTKDLIETQAVDEKPIKSTLVEVDNRIKEIQAMLLDGRTRSEILQFGSKWKVGTRQIDDYIKQARDEIKEINSNTFQDNLSIVIRNLWDLFREARILSNIQEQHKILMSLSKIMGLEKITVNHIIEDKRPLETMSDEELQTLMITEESNTIN